MLNIQDLKRFKELWERGLKSNEIARELGVAENLVPIYAIAIGLIPRKLLKNVWNRKVTPQVLIYMRDMFLDGATIREIAEYFEISERSVKQHLRNIGLRRRIKGAKERITKEKLKKLCERGYTDREIARCFGVSPQYIAILRRRFGISKRGPRGMFHVKRIEEVADIIMKEIYRKGYTTNRELREKSININWRLLRELEYFIEGLQWFRISHTSTSKHKVFPARLSGLIVIYVEGCEEEVANFLRRNLYNVPKKALLHILKSWSVPEGLYRVLRNVPEGLYKAL